MTAEKLYCNKMFDYTVTHISGEEIYNRNPSSQIHELAIIVLYIWIVSDQWEQDESLESKNPDSTSTFPDPTLRHFGTARAFLIQSQQRSLKLVYLATCDIYMKLALNPMFWRLKITMHYSD